MTRSHNTEDESRPLPLTIVAAYFVIGGLIALVSTIVAFPNGSGETGLVTLLGGGVGIVWLVAGILLWRRSRVGIFLAAASLLPEIATWFFVGAPNSLELTRYLAVLALIVVSWSSVNPSSHTVH